MIEEVKCMQEGFVDLALAVPGIAVDIRYATAHNLTGHPLAGYCAGKAVATEEAARALSAYFRSGSHTSTLPSRAATDSTRS